MNIATNASAQESLYNYLVKDINGDDFSLSKFNGNVTLIVNTASECGFTYQYEGLQKLYDTYKGQGFVVLAFPSNDFGGQEPGSNVEIKRFCERKFATTFPMFSKGPVKGNEKQSVYKFLTEYSSKEFRGDPGWNFVKILVDKKGQVIGRFSSMTKPSSKKLATAIEKALSNS